jgi:RHS repeat-associated protein
VRYYVGADHLGSPRVIADATGAIVDTRTYDTFGVLTSESDPSFALVVGYAGGIADPLTHLVRFGFRDYDPAAGRWVARDPALFSGGQANLYAYVGNDPQTLRDPTGLFCIGGSWYSGIGGGGQVCTTGNDLTVCLEVGFGVGGGLDATGGMPKDGSAVGVSASVKCGPVGLGIGVKLDSCGDLKFKGSGDLGPVGFQATPNGVQLTGGLGPVSASINSSGEVGVSGHIGAQDAFGANPSAGAGVLGINPGALIESGNCKVGAKLNGSVCKSLF